MRWMQCRGDSRIGSQAPCRPDRKNADLKTPHKPVGAWLAREAFSDLEGPFAGKPCSYKGPRPVLPSIWCARKSPKQEARYSVENIEN